MRVLVVSDIHGDCDALARALAMAQPFDRLLALGDSIDQSRFSAPVANLLRAHDAIAIRGNHEDAFFSGPGATARVAAVADTAARDWLAARPARVEMVLDGARTLLVHATPWPSDYAYVPPTSPAFARLADAGAELLLYGHTHLPVVRQVGGTLVVNPGSVGQGRPTATGFVRSFALLDPAARAAEIIDLDP